jgi:hypothetical protein
MIFAPRVAFIGPAAFLHGLHQLAHRIGHLGLDVAVADVVAFGIGNLRAKDPTASFACFNDSRRYLLI